MLDTPILDHLVAGDPRAGGDVLRLLTDQVRQGDRDTLALATHPHLPREARLHLPGVDTDQMHAALTHPHLPAPHRTAFLAATDSQSFASALTDHTCLTADDIAAHYRGHLHVRSRHLLANPHTPPELARDRLRRRDRAVISPGEQLTLSGSTIIYCAEALRHGGVTGAYPDMAIRAAASTDPMRTFGAELAAHITATGWFDWWWPAIAATSDPGLAESALNVSAPSGVYTAIAREVMINRHLPDRPRYQAALRSTWGLGDAYDLGRTAPADAAAQLALSPSDAVRDGVASNLNATPATLAVLARDSSYEIRWAVAMHPAAQAGTRKVALDHPQGTQFPGYATAALIAADPVSGLLNCPVPALREQLYATEGIGAHLRHHLTGARLAHHARPYNVSEALALRALEPTFTGTLRQLLDTVATVTA